MTALYHGAQTREDGQTREEAPPPCLTAVWSPARRALWDRIAAHDFDPDHPLGFARRLARDKGWTPDFARTAIAEYRRFCFLACAGHGPMTPSEEVDEVWHQHLTYTRDYWDIWCAKVLRGPLHHDPTQGGPAEQTKFRAQYAATLKTYEVYFGAPPAIVWPATHVRFGNGPAYRTVEAGRWLFVPHPRRLWRAIEGVLKRCR